MSNHQQPAMAYVNTAFVPLAEAKVHIEDRGFQFADGVYEVVACFGGAFFDLSKHLLRLQRSCEAIRIPLPKPLPELEALVQQAYALHSFHDAQVYLQVTRGVAPRSHLLANDLIPTLIITVRQLTLPSAAKIAAGSKGITLEDIRWKHCEIKSIALLASVLGKQEAAKCGADEAFWLDVQGHVLEGCVSNVLAVIDGMLVTHPLDHQVLGGITRDMAIAIARDAGMVVQERPWRLDEPNLSEILMSSTSHVITPICIMDDKIVGNGVPGKVGQWLRTMILAKIDSFRPSAPR